MIANHIAIEGVIGAGKTELAKRLSKHINADIMLENFESNPFLKNFYIDEKRYAFQTQMFFLVNRYKQMQDSKNLRLFGDGLVSDYLFEKDRLFARLNLSEDEFALYTKIASAMLKTIEPPDLVVYLKSSISRLMDNIKKRNAATDKNITSLYVEKLHSEYNDFFFYYKASPLLVVNANSLDFVERNSDFECLYNAILNFDGNGTVYLDMDSSSSSNLFKKTLY